MKILPNYFHIVVSLDFSFAYNVFKSYFVEDKNTVQKVEIKKANFWQTDLIKIPAVFLDLESLCFVSCYPSDGRVLRM